MPKASEVAAELRKLADSLDKNPDAEITRPTIMFSHDRWAKNSKHLFLALAQIMPKPLKKGDGYSHEQVTLTYSGNAVEVYASIAKSLTCELVEPAKPAVYRCDPILSMEEEEALA